MASEWPRRTGKQWVADTKRRLQVQKANRARLSGQTSIDEDALRSLDSTLKRTTAFMKKLKMLTGSAGTQALSTELTKLNLSKFVDEMAQAIADMKMKVADVPAVVDLCAEISMRYSKFSELLLTDLRKMLPVKKTDKIVNPAKLRIDLRFLCELILSGVLGKEGMQVLGACLTFLTATDKTEHVNVGLICSLCRGVGWQLAGVVPYPEDGQEEISIQEGELEEGGISGAHRKVVGDLMVDYLQSLTVHTEKAAQAMNVVVRKVKRQERTRGDGSAEDKALLETKKSDYDRLKALWCELSDALGMERGTIREEPSDDEEDEAAAREMDKALTEGQTSMWPDDESRAFYTNMLDIRTLVPKILYKDSEESTIAASEMATCVDDVNMEGLDQEGEEKKEITTHVPSKASNPEVMERSLSPVETVKTSTFEKFAADMDHLVNRDAADAAALNFVTELNTHQCRKRLVRLILTVSPSRRDLLPFYARLLTLLKSVTPDVTAEVTNGLLLQFREYIQKKRDDKVEEKIKCTLFIAELVKFDVVPRAEALACLRQLIYDFHGHCVEMACALIENAGFYLYRNTDTHPKMKIVLEVMKNKRERIKDVRQWMLIDNAYYTCLPDDCDAKHGPDEEPMKIFVRNLIVGMNKSNVESNIRLLRRLDWLDDDVNQWALEYLSSPWLVPYSNLRFLASCLVGLSKCGEHDWISIAAVDAVCETVRLALEVGGELNQQAMACVTYTGELYAYAACDSSLIYKMLYQMISFPESDESWADFFRIRVICELLNTVGEFFQTGSHKRNMDYFLTYFNRFYWMKREVWAVNCQQTTAEDEDAPVFPADVEAEYKDTMTSLRNGIKLPKNLTEAEEKVSEQEKILKDKPDDNEKALLSKIRVANTINCGQLAGNMGVQMDLGDEEVEEEEQRATNHRGLHHIMEEDESEENSDMDNRQIPSSFDLDDDEEEEKVHVHGTAFVPQPEDDDFLKELDRIMQETHRSAPAQVQAAAADLSVPAVAKEKFTRTIGFADEGDVETKPDRNINKVGLMTRGKGNKAVLKQVAIDTAAELHAQWAAERERAEKEREDIKRLTLGHTARIQAEEDAEQRNQITLAMGYNKKPQKERRVRL